MTSEQKGKTITISIGKFEFEFTYEGAWIVSLYHLGKYYDEIEIKLSHAIDLLEALQYYQKLRIFA